MPENKHLRFFVTLLYIALALFLFWVLFRYALGWFAPFIVAFFASRIIEYPVSFLEKRLKAPRAISSAVLTILFYGILGTVVYFVAEALIKELVVLFEKLRSADVSSMVDRTSLFFTAFLSRLPLELQGFIYNNIEGWLSNFVSALQNLVGPLVAGATNIAASLPSIMIFVIATIAATYFLSYDYKRLRKKLIEIMPKKWQLRIRRTKRQVSDTLVSYLRAVALLVCITFVELSIGFVILGVENAIILAAIVALIDALPILGTGWILFPWAIVALFSKNFVLAIGLAVLYAVIAVVRNLLEPKIVGQHIGLHPLVTLLSMYVGIKMFGIIGMFMPIPVALIKQFYEWGYFSFDPSSDDSSMPAK